MTTLPETCGAERIECAAIKHFDGTEFSVPSPGRHNHVIAFMQGRYGEGHHEQGFITSRGRFVDRREALVIASAAGQIRVKTGDPDVLYSEDVW